MEATRYLLDMAVMAELTRPNGNRRVFTLFAQRQSISALAAPVVFKLLQGVDTLPEGQRRTQLAGFVAELLRSGPPVLPFDRETVPVVDLAGGRLVVDPPHGLIDEHGEAPEGEDGEDGVER